MERSSPGLWVWLFPATYLIHIAEELWLGEGFHVWVSRFGGGGLELETFVALNAIALVFVIAGIAPVRTVRSMNWFIVAIATTLSLNGVTHLMASAYTASYSPGLISGNLLWIPLAVFGWWQVRHRVSQNAFRAAVLFGLLVHVVVIRISLL
jgi:hypothetical protein